VTTRGGNAATGFAPVPPIPAGDAALSTDEWVKRERERLRKR